uniref:(northern house mosquito) hypothetical protein n=1 Tax=Culex pipiens TaxID=7175 RepID=A0A8D8FQN4_CULPI
MLLLLHVYRNCPHCIGPQTVTSVFLRHDFFGHAPHTRARKQCLLGRVDEKIKKKSRHTKYRLSKRQKWPDVASSKTFAALSGAPTRFQSSLAGSAHFHRSLAAFSSIFRPESSILRQTHRGIKEKIRPWNPREPLTACDVTHLSIWLRKITATLLQRGQTPLPQLSTVKEIQKHTPKAYATISTPARVPRPPGHHDRACTTEPQSTIHTDSR